MIIFEIRLNDSRYHMTWTTNYKQFQAMTEMSNITEMCNIRAIRVVCNGIILLKTVTYFTFWSCV